MIQHNHATPLCPTDALVAMGGSTGGTESIRAILEALPAHYPLPILIVQHMPEGFTQPFARRLDATSSIEVREAKTGDVLRPGLALLAPGNRHMLVHRVDHRPVVALKRSPHVNGHRPSVDVLFNSVADVFGGSVCAVVLSGMGRDGAVGMLRLWGEGATTIAQEGSSCVVNGMPKAAIDAGGVTTVATVAQIAALVATYHGRPIAQRRVAT